MFEVNDDGSFLIKNSAVLGELSSSNDEATKKACHALSARGLVAKLKKEALLQERTESLSLSQDDDSLRRETLKEVAHKSTARTLDELENEILAHWTANQSG